MANFRTRQICVNELMLILCQVHALPKTVVFCSNARPHEESAQLQEGIEGGKCGMFLHPSPSHM